MVGSQIMDFLFSCDTFKKSIHFSRELSLENGLTTRTPSALNYR
jgi:hypothetical protein